MKKMKDLMKKPFVLLLAVVMLIASVPVLGYSAVSRSSDVSAQKMPISRLHLMTVTIRLFLQMFVITI